MDFVAVYGFHISFYCRYCMASVMPAIVILFLFVIFNLYFVFQLCLSFYLSVSRSFRFIYYSVLCYLVLLFVFCYFIWFFFNFCKREIERKEQKESHGQNCMLFVFMQSKRQQFFCYSQFTSLAICYCYCYCWSITKKIHKFLFSFFFFSFLLLF